MDTYPYMVFDDRGLQQYGNMEKDVLWAFWGDYPDSGIVLTVESSLIPRDFGTSRAQIAHRPYLLSVHPKQEPLLCWCRRWSSPACLVGKPGYPVGPCENHTKHHRGVPYSVVESICVHSVSGVPGCRDKNLKTDSERCLHASMLVLHRRVKTRATSLLTEELPFELKHTLLWVFLAPVACCWCCPSNEKVQLERCRCKKYMVSGSSTAPSKANGA